MSNTVYPDFPGVTWPVVKRPMHKTGIKETPSGREFRTRYMTYPRYSIRLSYEWLTETEMKQLVGLFNTHGGAFESFLFDDRDDRAVSNQVFAVGDGVTTSAQLVRTLGGFVEPVYDFNGTPQVYRVDWQGTQLLYSTARTNRLLQTEDLANAAWTKTRSTVTANATTAPDGTTTAERLVSDATAAQTHYTTQTVAGLADNQVVSCSVHLKQDVADRAVLQFVLKNGSSSDLEFKFDDQKLLRTSQGTGNTSVVHSVQAIGGWYRLKMEGINVGSGGTTPGARVILARNPTLAETGVWPRVGASGASSAATPPVAGKRVAALTEDTSTGGHYANASINFVAGKTYQFDVWAQVLGSGAARYLSLVLPSGTAWGVTQGATFDVSAGTVTVTTGTGASLAASITDAGGGWWLCRITATAVGTGAASVQARLCNVNTGVAPSYTGDGASGLLLCEPYIRCTDSTVGLGAAASGITFDGDNTQSVYAWGAQVEDGAVVTSYIRSTSSPATLTDYSITSAGLVTLPSPLPAGAQLQWSGNYYWRVRFMDDAKDFEEFLRKLWKGRVDLKTCKP
jgi:hypothetical protein